jgi:protein arginine kinase activator
MKCDHCTKPATVHVTEIRNGKKIEKNLCEHCANTAESVPTKNTPINQLLTDFVLAHSGLAKEPATACPVCGITWADFRQSGLLGCEHDYAAFDKDLTPLLQKAHDGGTHHLGKVPTRRGGTHVPVKRQMDLTRLRKELNRAVEAEDYERAAALRDQIRQAEAPATKTSEGKTSDTKTSDRAS